MLPSARCIVRRSCSLRFSARYAHDSVTPSESSRITTPNYDPSVNYTFRPASSSYFTGNAVYNDNLLKLEALTRKYSKLPELPLGAYPKTYWRTIEQYRAIDTTSHVRPTDHKKLLDLLNRLNRIDRDYMPQEVLDTMAYYTRERLGADPIKKVLKPDQFGRTFGVGRRKESVARVWVVAGDGQLFINGRTLPDFACRIHDRESIILPLAVTERLGKYNVWAYVDGGGTTGQAEAIQLGMAKAMIIHEPELKRQLRAAGCITADSRRVERKKTGKPKARKSYTWVKR